MFDRGARNIWKEKGLAWLLEDVASIFKQADFTVINLETAVTDSPTPVIKQFVFNSPPTALSYLRKAHVTHVNLANNHSVDHGKDGLKSTARWSSQYTLNVTGYGLGPERACEPVTIEKNDVRIAIFSTVTLPLERWYNLEKSPCICTHSPQMIADKVKALRTLQPETFIIVQLHWGAEYRSVPELHQIREAKILANSGADLIVGHHPHVIQKISRIDGTPVFFSLGNLIFDPLRPYSDLTALLQIDIQTRKNYKLYLHPLQIKLCKPSPMTTKGREQFKEYILENASGIALSNTKRGWEVDLTSQ